MRRFLRLLRLAIFGPERVVAYRVLKGDYWLSGYYTFNTELPNTTYTQTFRNHKIRATEVPNPFYYPGLAEKIRAEMEREERGAEDEA